jgi:hypothetical protein
MERGQYPKSLEAQLAAITRALNDHSEATRMERQSAICQGHLWNDEQRRAFMFAFTDSSAKFLELLESKRRIELEIQASKTGSGSV